MSLSAQQQQRQVSHLLYDELQCVSISGLSTRMGISRSQAAAMLDEVAAKDTSRQYQANYVVQNDEKYDETPCTVFRLEAKDYQPNNETPGFLYSLAVCSKGNAESLETAHERDMAHCRDLVSDNKLTTILSETTRFDIIEPHEIIRADYKQSAQSGYSGNDEPMETETTSAASAPTLARGGPKKVTTAASFFNSKPSTSNKTDIAAKAPKQTSKFSNKHPPIASTKSDEKENAVDKDTSAHNSGIKIGQVDDFVGDDESDTDEDSVDVKLRSSRQVASNRSAKKPSLTIDDSDDESMTLGAKKPQMKRKDEEAVVSGAMDAFASKKDAPEASGDVIKHKRRRKKLVEKTTMDASGYLHTETMEVWEDIPSEEDEPKALPQPTKKAAPKPAASKKSTASMKQGSLMGFFKKK